MALDKSIQSIDDCRQAYQAYVEFMEREPWASGLFWDQTLACWRIMLQAIKADPPDIKRAHSAGLGVSKGPGDDIWCGCPNAGLYGAVREAMRWWDLFERGCISDGEPIPAGDREAMRYTWEQHRRKLEGGRKQLDVLSRMSPAEQAKYWVSVKEALRRYDPTMRFPDDDD